MDEDVIMSIADAPVELPEPSQDYYNEYRAAMLQGEELFEVRLPPYREADDVSLNHNGDFIQLAWSSWTTNELTKKLCQIQQDTGMKIQGKVTLRILGHWLRFIFTITCAALAAIIHQ